MEKLKKYKVYLNFDKAVRDKMFVNKEEYLQKYDIDRFDIFNSHSAKKYELVKGAPLIRNIEGHYIYDSDILSLVDKKSQFFVQSLMAQNAYISYKWRR